MINKEKYFVYFKIIKNRLRMIKSYNIFHAKHYTNHKIYSKLRVVKKNTTCSLCNTKHEIVCETIASHTHHNFCLSCVEQNCI